MKAEIGMATRRFNIIYSDDIKKHLKAIPKKYWKLVKDSIAQQLSHEPNVETRNRKPLTKPPVDMTDGKSVSGQTTVSECSTRFERRSTRSGSLPLESREIDHWREGDTIMRIAPVAEVKAKLSKYLSECKNGAVVVTKNGKPTAALVAINNDDDLERIVLSESRALQKILARSEKKIRSRGGTKHGEFWANMEKGK